MGNSIVIKIQQNDDGCSVFVNDEHQHDHNWRSTEAAQKWADLIEKYFPNAEIIVIQTEE